MSSPEGVALRDPPGTSRRRIRIELSMCGQHNLLAERFLGCVGDWTWDLVDRWCGVDPYNAFTSNGEHTYLSYTYIHVKGSPSQSFNSLPLGAEIDVTSRAFNTGKNAIASMHVLRPIGRGGNSAPTFEEMYESPDQQAIYISTMNRWISRADSGNEDLLSSKPVGFSSERLSVVPPNLALNTRFRETLESGAFGLSSGFDQCLAKSCRSTYDIDRDRDVNGVGLLFYASYFHLVDMALARALHEFNENDVEICREIIEEELIYLANANLNDVLILDVDVFSHSHDKTLLFSQVNISRASDGSEMALAGVIFRQGRKKLGEYRLNNGSLGVAEEPSEKVDADHEGTAAEITRLSEPSANLNEKTDKLVAALRAHFSNPEILSDSPLISSGVIDSFSRLEYIFTAERILGVSLPDEVCTTKDMDSVNSLITALVRRDLLKGK